MIGKKSLDHDDCQFLASDDFHRWGEGDEDALAVALDGGGQGGVPLFHACLVSAFVLEGEGGEREYAVAHLDFGC